VCIVLVVVGFLFRVRACWQKYAQYYSHCFCELEHLNLLCAVQFFYSYLRAVPDCVSPVSFVVPTGAAGHVTAGMVAKGCGLPIAKLVAATNENGKLRFACMHALNGMACCLHATSAARMPRCLFSTLAAASVFSDVFPGCHLGNHTILSCSNT
jgi:hypothetical protein